MTDPESIYSEQKGIFNKSKNYSHIIWDWNGTLLNDAQIAVDVMAVLLKEHDLPALTLSSYRSVFGFPVVDYYKNIGFDFTKQSFQQVGDRFIDLYNQKVEGADLFCDMPELLKAHQKAGIRQFILSAASQWHLDEIVNKHGITSFFEKLCGIDNHYAESKVGRGKELLESIELKDRSHCLLIGDTDHDFEVGQALGLDVLLIADGHQSFARLSAIHDNVIASRFDSD